MKEDRAQGRATFGTLRCAPPLSVALAALISSFAVAPAIVAEALAVPEGDPVRHVFVSSAVGTGKLSTWADSVALEGLTGGDRICQTLAEAAEITPIDSGAFVAWLSDSDHDAYCRVQGLTGKKSNACDGAKVLPGAGPWARVDGLPWGAELDLLTSPEPAGGPRIQLDLDENGDLQADVSYMTGTSQTGQLTNGNGNCLEWDSDSLSASWDGSLSDAVDGWSGDGRSACSGPFLHIVCIEKGVGAALPPPAEPGALAFVTSTSCTGDFDACTSEPGDTGLEAADNICRARAIAGNLPSPESYFAWISIAGESAGARLTGPGPWRRVDGYPLAATAADWKDGRLTSALFVDELGGEVLYDNTWTGTNSLGNATGFDCDEWSSTDGLGTDGLPPRSGSIWTNRTTAACSTPKRLYCLSNLVVIFWNDFEPGGVDPEWSASMGLP